MTSCLRDLLFLKKEQMAELETQVVVKRNNLMSLFKEDDRADEESRGGLKETLIKKDNNNHTTSTTTTTTTTSSLSENHHHNNNNNKLGGALAQLVHLWACGNQSPSSLPSVAKCKADPELSQDCYQDAEFSTLVVRHGDCLSEISRLVDIPMEVLQRVNSIANIEYLKPGQNLRIPRKGISSKHRRFWDDKNKGEKRVIANWGDTLWSLADEHHVTADDIRRSNNLPMGFSHLYVGQELIIPSPPQTNCMTLSQGPPLRYLLRKENLATIPALRPIVSNKIVESLLPTWEPEPFGLPCHGGWLSSFYGWKDGRWYFHNGIDIAVERGTEVVASTSGKVTWSGWKGGYGKTVCMDHGNGYVTLYAHCDNLHVQPGQFVRKGQVIAVSGNTGHSTGPHLHFEIHKDGKTVDPLIHLPPL